MFQFVFLHCVTAKTEPLSGDRGQSIEMLETHLEETIGVIEDILESEVKSIEKEFGDIKSS